MRKIIYKMALTARHDFPEDIRYFIYPQIISDVVDVDKLEIIAYQQLEKFKDNNINLYVTGLTQALIAVLNVARLLNIKITLYHYNKDTGKYFPQEVR